MFKILNFIKRYGFPIIFTVMFAIYFKRILREENLYSIFTAVASQMGLFVAAVIGYLTRPTGWKFWILYFIFTVLYIGTTVIELLCGYRTDGHEYFASFAMGTSFYFCIYLFLNLSKSISNNIFRKICLIVTTIIFVALIFYPAIFYGYYFLERSIFMGNLILDIAQTNLVEAINYVKDNYSLFKSLVVIIVLIPFLIYCTRLYLSIPTKKIKLRVDNFILGIMAIFFQVLLILGMLFSTQGLDCLAKRTITVSTYMLGEYKDFIKHTEVIMKNVTVNVLDKSPGIHILVIGESLGRDYMSLYGYNEQTTPNLDQYSKTSPLFIKYEKAYTNYPGTVPALTYALTSKNQYNNLSMSSAVSLINISKKAGYKVYWISNQYKSSILDTPLISLTSQTDQTIYVYDTDIKNTVLHDELILKHIPEIHPDERVLVILHLAGSHVLYEDRFTPEFNIFNNDSNQRINQYKNSVLYNDYVMKLILDKFRKFPNFKSLVYFSDHGADPYQKADHNISHFNFKMVRIPLIMYFDKNFSDTRSQLIRNITSNKNKCYTNDLIYDLMLDILGIQSSSTKDIYSVGSSNYGIDCDNALTIHSEKKILEDNP